MIRLERSSWLGHRWRQHGLGAAAGSRADLLLVGVQDGRRVEAEQSLSARGLRPGRSVTTWSLRGAPHRHRLDALALVRAAQARQDGDPGGAEQAAAVTAVADALRAAVTGPTPKGEASTAVTAALPAKYVTWCQSCQAEHVPDGTFREAGFQAGLVLAEGRGTVLEPAPKHPSGPHEHPRRTLLEALFRLNGPLARATVRELATWGTPSVAALWKELGPVRVDLDGARLDLPEALVDEVSRAEPAEGVALVPPHDPYLKQVDKTRLVPDAARRREVYRSLSGPGALLVDGEVAGSWRSRGDELTVTAFGDLPAARRREVERAARTGVTWA